MLQQPQPHHVWECKTFGVNGSSDVRLTKDVGLVLGSKVPWLPALDKILLGQVQALNTVAHGVCHPWGLGIMRGLSD